MIKMFLSIFVICIVMGIVLQSLAVSPDKTQGDKTKVENLTPPPPPGYWNLYIEITDPNDSCFAYGNCNLAFFIQAATSHCVGILATPHYTQPISWGTLNYSISIPDTIPCAEVSVIDLGGNCNQYFTKSTCCKCQGDSKPCPFNICH